MVKVTTLKRIFHPKGDVYHALKASEPSFTEFGEAYFTTVHKKDVKGWKKHTKMTMNLLVPMGDVSFFIHNEQENSTQVFRVNEGNYVRLTVPPGYWVAFKGHADKNLILNVASLEHDPEEAINVPLSVYSLEES